MYMMIVSKSKLILIAHNNNVLLFIITDLESYIVNNLDKYLKEKNI